jgi:hypothetical protein
MTGRSTVFEPRQTVSIAPAFLSFFRGGIRPQAGDAEPAGFTCNHAASLAPEFAAIRVREDDASGS